MTTLAFDTLAFANKLKKGGVESKSAETQAEALCEVMKDLTKNQLVTKQDLQNEIRALEMRLYAFMVKATVFTVGTLGGLQTLFKFMHPL
jgi:hypothetical protein